MTIDAVQDVRVPCDDVGVAGERHAGREEVGSSAHVTKVWPWRCQAWTLVGCGAESAERGRRTAIVASAMDASRNPVNRPRSGRAEVRVPETLSMRGKVFQAA